MLRRTYRNLRYMFPNLFYCYCIFCRGRGGTAPKLKVDMEHPKVNFNFISV